MVRIAAQKENIKIFKKIFNKDLVILISTQSLKKNIWKNFLAANLIFFDQEINYINSIKN